MAGDPRYRDRIDILEERVCALENQVKHLPDREEIAASYESRAERGRRLRQAARDWPMILAALITSGSALAMLVAH